MLSVQGDDTYTDSDRTCACGTTPSVGIALLCDQKCQRRGTDQHTVDKQSLRRICELWSATVADQMVPLELSSMLQHRGTSSGFRTEICTQHSGSKGGSSFFCLFLCTSPNRGTEEDELAMAIKYWMILSGTLPSPKRERYLMFIWCSGYSEQQHPFSYCVKMTLPRV